MNTLPLDRKVHVIAELVEGTSIRSTERILGIHRDTIMRLGAEVGEACARLHDVYVRDLNVSRIELDEIWSFICKKEGHLEPGDSKLYGDQYSYIALDAINKVIISFETDKRTRETTKVFVRDLRTRVLNRPQISSDGYKPYIDAIDEAFGPEVDYGQVIKSFEDDEEKAAAQPGPDDAARIEKTVLMGKPNMKHIGTTHVERQNYTMRTSMRRFTRRASGHSKKVENHRAAIALHVAYYNFCRVHSTLRMTPAMAIGIADHPWSIEELITTAMSISTDPEKAPEPSTPTPTEKPPLSRAAVEKRLRWRDRRKGTPTLRVLRGGKSLSRADLYTKPQIAARLP